MKKYRVKLHPVIRFDGSLLSDFYNPSGELYENNDLERWATYYNIKITKEHWYGKPYIQYQFKGKDLNSLFSFLKMIGLENLYNQVSTSWYEVI